MVRKKPSKKPASKKPAAKKGTVKVLDVVAKASDAGCKDKYKQS